MTTGGRNLALLGAGAVLIAVITTVTSLLIYRETGDIYLDRSRPGYLPDEQEASKADDESTTYVFADSGELTAKDLEEYLQELNVVRAKLQAIDAYGGSALSDESLGIPSETPTENTAPNILDTD